MTEIIINFFAKVNQKNAFKEQFGAIFFLIFAYLSFKITSMLKRVSLSIYGIVQGVGFRYYTVHKARCLGLTGWVKNGFDGSVQLLIEGEEGKVNEMIDWCKRGPSSAYVSDVNVQNEDYTNEFSDFKIIY